MRKIATAFFLIVLATRGDTAQAVVTFDWATVGNPGNGPDKLHPIGNPNNVRFGSVANTYRISKYEVTNAQYTEFLNAADPTGTNALAIYNPLMSSNANGGINFNNGAANGSKYQLKPGRDNNPVIYVSYFDAMRFTNWLQNGQGSGTTESGVYTIGNGFNETRNSSATYFLPSEDEWYKASYHTNDGVTGNYWDYPTSTDSVPYSDQPPGIDAPTQSNTANFVHNDGIANGYDDGFAVTGTFSSTQNYLTDVGAYTASLSPYGTFDQAGNVAEWNEGVIGSSRIFRGGGWFSSNINLHASNRQRIGNPSFESFNVGFRVASIPEPSSAWLILMGTPTMLIRRKMSYDSCHQIPLE